MTYRLVAAEPLVQGLRRALVEELDAAAGQLDAIGDEGLDEPIHEARKSLKRSRTVLRLLRDVLGDVRWRAANDRLRDAGRALSGTRDAAVLLEAVDGLGGDVDSATVAGLRDRLAREHAEARRLALADAGPRAEALERIVAGRADAARWDLGGDLDGRVLLGVERVYRRGRGRMRAARREPTHEVLHEWRKRVKDLGYTLTLAGPAYRQVLEPFAGEAQRLWGLLGDDQDLHLLAVAAGARADAFAAAADLQAVHDLIAARRAGLQHEAFRVGRRLYAEPPKAFAARVGAYLRAWQREAADDSVAREALGERPA